ncbi:MAG TPA: hypothetical protein VKG80_20935 [Trebonia sp.]|nr:hypothetical protein [Trebonia sp.]
MPSATASRSGVSPSSLPVGERGADRVLPRAGAEHGALAGFRAVHLADDARRIGVRPGEHYPAAVQDVVERDANEAGREVAPCGGGHEVRDPRGQAGCPVV